MRIYFLTGPGLKLSSLVEPSSAAAECFFFGFFVHGRS